MEPFNLDGSVPRFLQGLIKIVYWRANLPKAGNKVNRPFLAREFGMSDSEAKILSAKFSVGDLVKHKLFDYRGVVIDVDPEFQLTEEWYDTVARSRPPKDKPWYHVLVHKGNHQTYVAEQNLEPDSSNAVIEHPLVGQYFTQFRNGRYQNERQVN